jgi:tRNA modification GTPase
MNLRQALMDFASLVELELDFSEEDVEFADRAQLIDLVDKVNAKVAALLHSYKLGNVIKNGVPVAIVGSPNAGKSTLLNALLKEEKAIVSPIAGTTRDVIEDTIVLNGINFRFIDTAGLRETKDSIERLGIERAYAQIRKASVILLLIDLSETKPAAVLIQIEKFRSQALTETQTLIPVFNKLDEVKNADFEELNGKGVFISAKNNWHLDELIERLSAEVEGYGQTNETIVTNVRHYEILKKCELSLQCVQEGLKNQIPGDLLAMDIRETLHHLGEITGQITSDDLLGNIFANFCIGK